MRSPKDMRIIQIDITNACVHSCSNCTRFCGHHKNPFFMDWETFKRAVDSLTDFNKTVGIMGGEPTLHPQFERFVKYIAEKYPSKNSLSPATKPIKKRNFIEYIRDRNFYLDETLNNRKGPGLWTSLSRSYYEYYELIQDVFSYQTINDHNNPCIHQPLLASRKELGIPDDKWTELRDKCWIQNTWSATITPKGAFFCEVAGALDMLFDGPGGWPIEPGWWKREPRDFGYQLKWCEICGAAIFNEGRLSSEEIDDVSPMLYEKLKNVQSPKLKKGKVKVMDISNPKIIGKKMPDTINRYLTDYKERISKDNNVLTSKNIDAIVFCYSKSDLDSLEKNIDTFAKVFDSILVAVMDDNINGLLDNMQNKYSNVKIINSVLGKWGRTLNKSINCIENNDWICILNAESELPEDFSSRIKKVVLNPGCIYSFNILELLNKLCLFNRGAYALKYKGFDGISECGTNLEFVKLWDKNKQIVLNNDFDIIDNPDLKYWYDFANTIDEKNKEKIYKCLDKIKNDLEIKTK